MDRLKKGFKPIMCLVCGWEDTGFEESPDEKPSDFMMPFNERGSYFKEKRKADPEYKWDKE